MREIRQSGSEGGGNEQTVSPYPYFIPPPTPNPLIYDFKPTHCAGWVCLISHHLKNKKPMERIPFRANSSVFSVKFRVNPWLCLCVFLVLFPCFSVFVRGKLSLLIVFISVEFCFNRWLTSVSLYCSYRG